MNGVGARKEVGLVVPQAAFRNLAQVEHLTVTAFEVQVRVGDEVDDLPSTVQLQAHTAAVQVGSE